MSTPKWLSLKKISLCTTHLPKDQMFWEHDIAAERLTIQMQWSWQVVYFCICVLFSKSLWLCMDLEWCSPFQRILGLQWGWQSVLLVCDGQRWGSQGRSALVVKHTHTHTPVVLCCPLLVIGFTAKLGLVFQATSLQGNYQRRGRQQQIRWVQP